MLGLTLDEYTDFKISLLLLSGPWTRTHLSSGQRFNCVTIEEAQAALQFSACDVHKSMAEFGLFAEVYVQSQIDDAIFHRMEEAHAFAVRRAWLQERFCNNTDTAWKTTQWGEDKHKSRSRQSANFVLYQNVKED
ncbi:hypothetical protein B0H13DRAFT_1860969 [Mycena leptocephala]|nr:hypothetical protein B0H13DRAFT_1860969 [Mycena leptocephala]